MVDTLVLAIIIAVIAGLFSIFCVFLAAWLRRDRITFWRHYKAVWAATGVILLLFIVGAFVAVLGIPLPISNEKQYAKIMQPINGDNVTINELVEGISTNIPEDNKLWIFVSVTNINRYYPMEHSVIIQYNGNWSHTVTLGTANDTGGQFDIMIVSVDHNAQNEINSYSTTVHPENNYYPGMSNIPTGTIILDTIRVTRNP